MTNTIGYKNDRDGLYIEKTPAAVLPYTLDYTDWLSSDTIATSNWTVSTISGDASALTQDSESETTTKTTIVLSGGTAGKIYTVSNTITTTAGYTEKRHFRVVVKERSA